MKNIEYKCDACGKIFDANDVYFEKCGGDEVSDWICPTCYSKIKEYDNNIRNAFKEYYEIIEKVQKENGIY